MKERSTKAGRAARVLGIANSTAYRWASLPPQAGSAQGRPCGKGIEAPSAAGRPEQVYIVLTIGTFDP